MSDSHSQYHDFPLPSQQGTGWPWMNSPILVGDDRPDLPRISIITPSYNQGQYLEETIRSIVLQNYSNYELIIIDGGSTDNTVDVIRKYEQWITYWVSEKDRGQSHAIQKGLAVATGDIINWLNSDDLLAPNALFHIAKEFDLESHDVICGYCDYFLDKLEQLDLRNERMGLGETIGEIFLKGKINQPSTFYKSSIIKKLSIDEQFRYTMDLDLWYRYLLQAGKDKVFLSNNLFSYFRLHGSSKSVAESTYFEGDIWKVYYNILYSLDEKADILSFVSLKISDFERFSPEKYPIGIPNSELEIFVRYFAELALHYYNQLRNYKAVRVCLSVLRRNGQPLNGSVFKQIIKLYILPDVLIRWIATRSLK